MKLDTIQSDWRTITNYRASQNYIWL